MNIFWIALVFGAAAAAQALLFSRRLRALRYRRAFSKTSAHEGEALEMIETLENRSLLPVPWLRVESNMPPALRFGDQENLTIVEDRYHRSFFFLGPMTRVVRRHRVHCSGRGYFSLSSAALTYGDLLGLKNRSVTLDLDMHVTIWPRLAGFAELAPPSTRMQGDVLVKRWIMPDLFLVGGIRPWRAGDTPRDVHWRATARTGSLKVKQYDYTASPKLMVLFNIQLSEHQWGDVAAHDRPRVEEAIRTAASLMLDTMERGIEVGFGCNGELVTAREQTVLIPPMASESARALLLDTLARLSLRRALTFPSFLESVPRAQGQDILILTPYSSEKIEEQAAALRACGNSVALRSWEGGTPDDPVA